jgi:hypothetical protein
MLAECAAEVVETPRGGPVAAVTGFGAGHHGMETAHLRIVAGLEQTQLDPAHGGSPRSAAAQERCLWWCTEPSLAGPRQGRLIMGGSNRRTPTKATCFSLR